MSHRPIFVATLVLFAHACVVADETEERVPSEVEVSQTLERVGDVVGDKAEEWVPSEVEVSATLDRIDDPAYQTLCWAFDAFIHDKFRSSLIVKAACTAHALSSTGNATECTAVADACLAKLPSPVEEDVQAILAHAGCAGLGVSRNGCRSPVSELIACLGDVKAALDHTALSVTCGAAFDRSVPHEWWRISPPSSCVDLVTRCR